MKLLRAVPVKGTSFEVKIYEKVGPPGQFLLMAYCGAVFLFSRTFPRPPPPEEVDRFAQDLWEIDFSFI